MTQAPTASPSHPSWQGPCVLGELCGGEPYAGGVSAIRGNDTGGQAGGDPEEAAVSILLQAPRHTALPVAFTTRLPRQGMHAHAP